MAETPISTNRCKLLCVFSARSPLSTLRSRSAKPVSASESAYVHTPRVSWFSPCEAAGGDRQIAFIQQNGLDAGGTEFNAEYSFCLNRFCFIMRTDFPWDTGGTWADYRRCRRRRGTGRPRTGACRSGRRRPHRGAGSAFWMSTWR